MMKWIREHMCDFWMSMSAQCMSWALDWENMRASYIIHGMMQEYIRDMLKKEGIIPTLPIGIVTKTEDGQDVETLLQ